MNGSRGGGRRRRAGLRRCRAARAGSVCRPLGLGDSLSARIPLTGKRPPLHQRGKVLTQAMLAGGGEACSDIEHLRAQEELFGSVPSDSTLYRTFRQLDAHTLAGLWEAMTQVPAHVWCRSLHQIHSENKEEAAANYKGGFGYHPIYCFADATGEALAVRLRPSNAGANNIADHLGVLDAAIAQLPEKIALGHRRGDDPSLVRRGLQVRVDSAGCSDFVWHARARSIGFAVVARSNGLAVTR
ncbi:MAG TPA: transposase [Acidimicrobiales bacterium]|nr:transposase [Acidimicrobiales bacterium]